MRNPLNTIQMNLEALKRRLGDDPTYLKLYELAHRQTFRLQAMLDHLLNYSKPLVLHKEQVCLQELVQESLAQMQERMAAARIELHCVQLPEAVMIAGDAEQLLRVFTNVLENSLHALEGCAEARITVTMTKLTEDTVSGATVNGRVQVRIADNGPGVPAGMRERIFQAFFTTRSKGTGLGLAIVKKIMDLHRGSVTLEPASGQGACFVLEWPCFDD